MTDNVNVTFGLRSDALNPQEVSTHLGLIPAHSFRQGDTYPTKDGRTLTRPFGVWQLRSEEFVDSVELENHANYLLTVLEPVQDRLARYLSNPSIYVEIRLWLETESETGGYSLTCETLARLARICNAVNFTYILKRVEQ